jgi:hypothetical protein
MKSDKSKILFSMFPKLEKPNKIRRAADSQLTVRNPALSILLYLERKASPKTALE